jgi:hypothetical protein
MVKTESPTTILSYVENKTPDESEEKPETFAEARKAYGIKV